MPGVQNIFNISNVLSEKSLEYNCLLVNDGNFKIEDIHM